MSKEEILSPCIRNCCLSQQDICLGCFRHIDEIVGWRSLSVANKQAVLLKCRERQKINDKTEKLNE